MVVGKLGAWASKICMFSSRRACAGLQGSGGWGGKGDRRAETSEEYGRMCLQDTVPGSSGHVTTNRVVVWESNGHDSMNHCDVTI